MGDGAIGIIGGVGPYAGLDVVRKVFDNTVACSDQEHIDLYMVSCPSLIPDRTAFLLDRGEDPAAGLVACFGKLAMLGATVVGIPCNTAHAPAIYDRVRQRVLELYPSVVLLNMVDETCRELNRLFPQGAVIGLMATLGTHASGLYREYLDRYPGIALVEPSEEEQRIVHGAIYNKEFGIKAVSPVTDRAVADLVHVGSGLVGRGCSAVILGCTELPLALHAGMLGNSVLVDPTNLLARAAVRAVAPTKLRG